MPENNDKNNDYKSDKDYKPDPVLQQRLKNAKSYRIEIDCLTEETEKDLWREFVEFGVGKKKLTAVSKVIIHETTNDYKRDNEQNQQD